MPQFFTFILCANEQSGGCKILSRYVTKCCRYSGTSSTDPSLIEALCPCHTTGGMSRCCRCSSAAEPPPRSPHFGWVVHTTGSIICDYSHLGKWPCPSTTVRDSYVTLCHRGDSEFTGRSIGICLKFEKMTRNRIKWFRIILESGTAVS